MAQNLEPRMSPALAPLVAEVWSARLEPGEGLWVLPDGCVDLVFRDGAAPALLWVGPMTRAERVAVEAPARFVGVRLRPGAAPALLGADARALLDGDRVERDARLLDALVASPAAASRRAALLDAMAELVRGRRRDPDWTVMRAADAIVAAGGALSPSSLARDLGVSERTLRRRFLAAVGYGPKRLCRVARLGAARKLASQGLLGADLAAAAGYFDQAHLCHEVAGFGLTTADLAA